ncbi:hypothetical protein NHQ30_008549 [Ciborinia camelliae]|nr:hypothetical protein NHQ30_008549 [Ciborinia camelliae]
MSNLTEFTLFPKLSPEIKAIIWDLASQEPNRIIFDSYRIRKRKYPKRNAQNPISDRDKIFCGKHPRYPNPRRLWAESRVPAVLITCRESRHWAMRHYSLCFESQLYYKALWFNPKVDTIIFTDLFAACVFGYGGVAKRGPVPLIQNNFIMPVVERIVIRESLKEYFYAGVKDMVKYFHHLKSLVMRTDGVRIEINNIFWRDAAGRIMQQRSVRLNLEEFWNSEEWKAVRAHEKKPEFRIMTPVEMWHAGFAKPLGPSNKPNRRPRIFKAKQAGMLPVRRSSRIGAIESARNAEH